MAVTRTSMLAETEIHDILRNDRRRRVIEHLQERVGTVTLRELAESVACRECGEDPPPRPLRESVYNSLHQTHLPKLDREGVVAYDEHRKTVSLQPPAREVGRYMDVVTRYGVTWADYYRSVGTASLTLVVASEAGLPGVSVVPGVAWASVALAVLAASTAYQLWSRRWAYLRSIVD